jgi:hypothetical protein
MALQQAALVANEPHAVQIAGVCSDAGVELLRYPVPMDKQLPGQTMAVGAIGRCLNQYGPEILTVALRCVTQTSNNKAGVLNARIIKALCNAIARGQWHNNVSELVEAADATDLLALQDSAAVTSAIKKIGRVQALADLIYDELSQLLPVPAAINQEASENSETETAEAA